MMIRRLALTSATLLIPLSAIALGQGRDMRRDTEGAVENILSIARGEGLEIHAYAFRRARERGLPIAAKVLDDNARILAEQAPLAAHWLPVSPAMENTPSGYGSASQVIGFHLSGQDIALSALTARPGAATRSAIEALYRKPALQPACVAPWYDTNSPLYDYLAQRIVKDYPAAGDRLALLDHLSAPADNAFDLAPLLHLVAQSGIRQPQDLGFLAARVAAILDRVAPPVLGAAVLAGSLNLDHEIHDLAARCAAAQVDAAALQSAYRRFLLRLQGQNVCLQPDRQPDRRDLAARAHLVEAFNRWAVSAIEPLEVDKAARGRQTESEPELAFEPPSDLLALARQISRPAANPAEGADTLNEFLDRWSKWHPKGEDDDPRWVDAKAVLVLSPLTYAAPADRRKLTPAAVNYLSRHWLKQREPGLWLTYSAILFSMAGGLSNSTRPIPADIDLIKDIHRANDQALAALARLELLKPLKTP